MVLYNTSEVVQGDLDDFIFASEEAWHESDR